MKPGRNDACHCGSDQKYKKCCLTKDDAARSAELAALAAAAAAQAATDAAKEGEEEAARVAAGKPARGPDAPALRPKPGAGPQPSPIRRRAV